MEGKYQACKDLEVRLPRKEFEDQALQVCSPGGVTVWCRDVEPHKVHGESD